MASDAERDVYRVLHEYQKKYTYFLAAAAASGVALAVARTEGAVLSWGQVPLAVAVLAWAVSFFAGCRYVGYVNATLYANHELLRVQAGRHPETGQNPQMVQAACEGILSAIAANNERASRWGRWQFRLLVAGGVSYVAWHVVEMYQRT